MIEIHQYWIAIVLSRAISDDDCAISKSFEAKLKIIALLKYIKSSMGIQGEIANEVCLMG